MSDGLRDRLAPKVSERAGAEVSIESMGELSGGACQDNYRIELDVRDGPMSGRHEMVLRADARSSLPGSIRRKDEFAVIKAAVAAGVKTPEARWLMGNALRDGSDAYLMDFIPGVAIGRQVLKSAELEEARRQLPVQLAKQLAKIHSIRPETHPDLMPERFGWGHGTRSPVDNTLAALRKTFDGMPEPHPALELALEWLSNHRPDERRITLVHGDFRTGNFMVTPDGLSGILDWEFAHWGCPEEDLAWISVRDWRFGQLDRPIGGFGDRETFYSAYEEATGHPVDRTAVHFWEVWGNVHWAAGCVYQGERYLSGEEADLELLAIARRAAEMELEAIRLIEKGAP